MNDSEQRRRDRTDMQRLIGLVLASPISKGKTLEVDGELSLSDFNRKNVDVRTRMLLQVATNAMDGDIKAAEFLMKYGGFEPVKEAEVSIEVPTFIDDITTDTAITAATDDSDKLEDKAFVQKALSEAKKKEDVITDTQDIPVVDMNNE